MDIIFSNIEERDTDFAIIRSFKNNEKVRNLFFSQINRKGNLIKIYHSLPQQESDGHTGESDIVFICEDNEGKYAIFIEDKIAADPQPKQRQRYDDRAELLKLKEGFKKHYVFLCAPRAYLGNSKADGYKLTVAHEDIMEVVDDELDRSIFDYSCNVKEQKYTPIKNDAVTSFWPSLYEYVDKHYPKLTINRVASPRGSNAAWPSFKIPSIKGLRIVWKSDIKRNCVDLEFRGMAEQQEAFMDIIKRIGATNFKPARTNKSMSLTVKFSKSDNVSFNRPFDEQIENIKKFLDVVNEFNELTTKIYYEGINEFPLK